MCISQCPYSSLQFNSLYSHLNFSLLTFLVVSNKFINHKYICTSGMLSLRLTDLFQLQVTITEHHFWFKGSRTASPNSRFTSKLNSVFVDLTCFYTDDRKCQDFQGAFLGLAYHRLMLVSLGWLKPEDLRFLRSTLYRLGFAISSGTSLQAKGKS